LFIKTGVYTILFNLFLNFILIKYFGVIGAVSSTILSYMMLISLLFSYSRSINNIKWPIKKIMHGAVLIIIIISIFKLIKDYNQEYEIIIKFVLLLLFPMISIFTKLIGNKEINGLRYLWNIMVKKNIV